MTLEQLRIFVAVAERLHMTRAAEALHVTQSAASASVAALEARYGVRLFDRVGRGLQLSEAGRVFLPEARAVLTSAQTAERALDDLAGLRRGVLVIAASQTMTSYWLPPRMARFAVAFPGVELQLRVGNTAEAARLVVEGSAELGFVEGEVDNPALRGAVLAEDRIALFTAPDHPLAATAVQPHDLAEAVWVLRERGSGTRAETERALAAHGVDPAGLNIALELPSNEAALAAVAGGGLVAAVSEIAAEAAVATGRVVSLGFPLATRRFAWLAHKERRRSRAAQAFLDLL
jgi:DNA-binding transcriptional LysR family regulator